MAPDQLTFDNPVERHAHDRADADRAHESVGQRVVERAADRRDVRLDATDAPARAPLAQARAYTIGSLAARRDTWLAGARSPAAHAATHPAPDVRSGQGLGCRGEVGGGVGALPREVAFRPPEVAVGRSVAEDRPPQVEPLDDRPRQGARRRPPVPPLTGAFPR